MPNHPRSAEPETRLSESKGPSVRVVVVDDNADSAQSLAMMIELFGHEVAGTAHDGPSAVELILKELPQVVFLDVGLPGFDGWEVARRVRQDSRAEAVFLVAVTGYGMDSDLDASRDAGFGEHFVKPIDPDRIRSLLEEIARKAGG